MKTNKIISLALLALTTISVTACQMPANTQPITPTMPSPVVSDATFNQELLKYQWRLHNAIDAKGQEITSLTDIKQQVNLSFVHAPDGDSIGFSVGCNGHGANYKINSEGQFVTEFIMATRMYCEDLDKAERTLVSFMSDNSQLSLLESKPLLLKQVTDAGATLTWQAVE